MNAPLCPFCGAYSPRSCDLEEDTGGFCPWEEMRDELDDGDDDDLEGMDWRQAMNAEWVTYSDRFVDAFHDTFKAFDADLAAYAVLPAKVAA